MRRLFRLILLVSPVITLLAAAIHAQPGKSTAKGCPGRNGLTAVEIAEIVEAHNAPRAEVKLGGLTWDCKLADFAQEWATRGIFEHRTGLRYGENLFVASSVTVKATSSVHQWLSEKASWDGKTASCAAGKICTHYTQIVWKKTSKMGCGINRGAPGKWKVLLVCNYDPPGNNGGPPF